MTHPNDLADDLPRWPMIVLPWGGTPGMGLLMAPDLIVTCAHLIDPLKPKLPPSARIGLTPLFANDVDLRTGSVVGWKPAVDLALIRVSEAFETVDLPATRYPERMGIARSGHRWRAWAIPLSAAGHIATGEQGMVLIGQLRGAVRSGAGHIVDRIGAHRYQVATDGEHLLESGFSGAAVRDEDADCVVGLLTSRSGNSATSRIGFLMAMEGIVEAFPVLRPWVGWQFATDSGLRAAWRWEDRGLGRPTLGSYFTGRNAALRALGPLIRDQADRA